VTKTELNFLQSPSFVQLSPIQKILIRALMTGGVKAFYALSDVDFRFKRFDDVAENTVVVRERKR
jgi:hypothetical protein